jgi:hypothetical protein
MVRTSQYYKRSTEFVSADMDGDTVMMSLQHGNYFGLSAGVGARLWDLLSSPMQLDEMVEIITHEFEVDTATCRLDLEKFIDALLEHDLIIALDDKS